MQITDDLHTRWLEMAVREVSTQCKLALASFQVFAAPPINTDIPFLAIQAFLSHCANASKMLQAEQEPGHSSKFREGWRDVYRWLRRFGLFKPKSTIGDILAFPSSSVIHREGREFRNNLEHYDQRLFKWLRKYGPKVNIADFNVMPKAAIAFNPNSPVIYIRNLDLAAQLFTFVDKDLDLAELREELLKIKVVADEWLAKRLPRPGHNVAKM